MEFSRFVYSDTTSFQHLVTDRMTIKEMVSKFFDPTKYKASQDENSDEIVTVHVDVSDDGFRDNDEEFGRFKIHPKERRRQRTERVAIYTLAGFFLVMFAVLMSLKNRQANEAALRQSDGSMSFQEGALASSNYTNKNNTNVYCSGKLTYSLQEWLDEKISNTATLCDPDVRVNTSIVITGRVV